ncbi:MAG TPA: hypothetical protein VHT03_04730 [Rhizomicrobium sp.]|jgi:hypothetical protein|nr:hypothetical protein [Rhizomicrobium sp.]
MLQLRSRLLSRSVGQKEANMSDLLNRPSSAFFWWCLPFATGFAGQIFLSSPNAIAIIWATALAWMGAGCALNAIRCRRLHCYIAAPVLLLAAFAEISLAAGFPAVGPHAANNIAGGALILALVSYVPELLRGRYLHATEDSDRHPR